IGYELMVQPRIRIEDSAALVLAVLVHAGLFAWLVLAPQPKPVTEPERMTVTLSDEVSLKETSTEQKSEEAAATAPELAPEPVAEPAPAPIPQPKVMPRVEPSPLPLAVAKLPPMPLPKPAPKQIPAPAKAASAKPAPAKPKNSDFASAFATPRAKPAGASKLGPDFLKGVADAKASGAAKVQAAATIGPAVQSALVGAISRQLKPRWVAPQGADAEKLVTVLAWSLNQDGSLAGKPVVVRQEGINDANRPQSARHAEQAIRAVELAAPFALPPEYYSAWKRVSSFRFDRKLSQ
ncbi:MAG: hypothetical protein ABIR23_09295, partial [Novosphingobium sp.]